MKVEKALPRNPSYLLILTGLLFGGLFYLYYPHIQNYSTTPKWLFVSFFSLFLLFLGKKEKLSWSMGVTIWFAFIVLYLFESFWSYNFWDSVVRTIPWILAPFSVLLIARQEKDLRVFYPKLAFAIGILIAPIVLLALLELTDLLISGSYSHASTYQFRYTFGNRNQFCELLALIVPILSIGAYFTKEKWRKVFFFSLIGLIYLMATLLQNRAAILVLYAIYPLFFALFLFQGFKPKTKKYAHLVLLACVLIGTILVFSPLRKNIPVVRNLVETGYGSGNERVRIWSNSIDLWKESPVFGKGSGDWKIEILKTPLEHTQADNSTVFFQRAHNDFLQVAVENGLVGLVLFVTFFIVSIVLLFKSDIEFRSKIILLAGVAGYVLISNFSFPIEKIELLILLFLFFLPGIKKNFVASKKLMLQKFIVAAMVLSVIILGVSWLKNEQNYFLFKGENNVYAFEEINLKKYTIDPTSTPLEWHSGNSFYNKADYKNALISYHSALEHNPYHVHVLNNMGSCHYALQEMEQAEKYYRTALSLNPKFVETRMNFASFQFNKGLIDSALVQILSIPGDREPKNYRVFIKAIAQAKYKSLMDLYDEPEFENFLETTFENDAVLYHISERSRYSGASYEVELRKYAIEKAVIPLKD